MIVIGFDYYYQLQHIAGVNVLFIYVVIEIWTYDNTSNQYILYDCSVISISYLLS